MVTTIALGWPAASAVAGPCGFRTAAVPNLRTPGGNNGLDDLGIVAEVVLLILGVVVGEKKVRDAAPW